MDYYPYGGIKFDTKANRYVGEKRKYADTEYDALSSLNYMQARYQNSSRGQFISEDPVFLGSPDKQNLINPQSLNTYSYSLDNPIRFSDPSGMASQAQIDQLTLQALSIQLQLAQIQLQQLQSQQAGTTQSQSLSTATAASTPEFSQSYTSQNTAVTTSATVTPGSVACCSFGQTVIIGASIFLPELALEMIPAAVGAPTLVAGPRAISAITGPFIESVGVDTTAAEYASAQKALDYASRQLGWDDVPWSSLSIKNPAVQFLGLGAAGAVGNWLYKSFHGSTEGLDEGP